MANVELKVGDRVVAIKSIAGYSHLKDKEGKAVADDGYDSFGVEFDERFGGGHACGGRGKEGHCRYGNKNDFQLVKTATKDGIEVGDTVEVLQDKASGSYWLKGEEFVVESKSDDSCYGKKDAEKTLNFVHTKYLKLVTNKKGGEEGMVRKVIADNFEKTADANLVEEHLGSQIGQTFIDGLVVAANKDAILAEAQRLEAAKRARNKE